ncbi:LytR/AlgR family response regulator transcription factor [Sporomusa acidovorans]|uniref:Transcriptional regulatory protein YpdB n=1 Tax=Sporomusa acidovorans (strain ATCC 49682 / DSM 3132 / Mol) TaxID=1123286 RepID=A0ABZ3J3X4_SPOA4|nr:LytTR family DNA-binding domain-containing protein [Sporomusa acidovorans]OZC20308.1 transcriptional regulatory protein YpdB [Sporomusa acidovorans DSM 3132]SDD38436.1 two component transcriptional regulator, LytTR family [Sporomusa acidovorans]
MMTDQLCIIRVIIVDDEEPARSELRFLLEQFEEVEIVGEFSSGEAALKAITSLRPHLIFVDIEMPGISGLQTAEKMKIAETFPLVVFATAHEEFAVKAFELNAADYLLKPFSSKRVAKCIDKVRTRLAEAEQALIKKQDTDLAGRYSLQKLAIEYNGKAVVIASKDIIAAYCTEGQLLIRTADKCYYSNMPLQDLQSRLDDRLFFRTHRAYLVNIEKIREIIPWFNGTYNLILEGLDEEIPVSRQQVSKLKKLFGL